MSERVYESLDPISIEEAERVIRSGQPAEVGRALLRAALHGPDWARAEAWALDHLHHPDAWVRRNAATSLGHIARIDGRLDVDRVVPALVELLADPKAGPYADDALGDIAMFMKIRRTDFRR